MHPVRLLLDRVPELLVELRALPRTGGAAAGGALARRLARREHRRAARQSRGSVPDLPLPHHHELRQGLSQEPQSRQGDRRHQTQAGRTAGVAARVAVGWVERQRNPSLLGPGLMGFADAQPILRCRATMPVTKTNILGWWLGLTLFAAAPSCAEEYPSRPVRIVSQAGVGSAPDVMARIVADQLGKAWGQQAIIINRPGASGANAAQMAAGAEPDGYTLFLDTSSHFTRIPETTT